MTTIESLGRRHYLRGLPFAAKDAARAAGCKWDPEERCWWTGKRETAEALIDAPTFAKTPTQQSIPDAPGPDAMVAGKVTYKGKTYYVAGRVVRGRTQYDDAVEGIATQDGAKLLLYSRDGSLKFWAPRDLCELVKRYDRPQTIGGLRRFAEEARANGGTHPDACPNCGSLSCSTAYGRRGLCDED